MIEREISSRDTLFNFLSANFLSAEKAERAADLAYHVKARTKPLKLIKCEKNGVLLVARRCEQLNKRSVLGVSSGDLIYGVYDTNTKKIDRLSLAGYFAMIRSKDF